jgi:hypothetical protein
MSGELNRRSFFRKASGFVAGAAAAVGLGSLGANEASAAYTSYVIANRAPARNAPNTSAPIYRYRLCGTSYSVTEVAGQYACSCNECTSIWAKHGNAVSEEWPTYIHRGNLNPYTGGACECWY